MVMVVPFRGVRYNAEKVGVIDSVLAPPYDVINPEEQNELYEKNPYNVVRIILPKNEDDEKYIRAGESFRGWIKGGVLIQDSEPCIYPYYQEFKEDGKTVTRKGFIAAVRLEDFSSKRVIPHERTFAGPKLDRLKLTSACRANLSPVFAIYSDPEGAIETAIEKRLSKKPIVDAVGGDGVRNYQWRLSDNDLLSQIKTRMLDSVLLIADGHHRYETALEYRNIQRKGLDVITEDKEYEYVMMYLSRVEGDGLVIKPTHRLVKNLGTLDIDDFLKRLKDRFSVEKVSFNDGISSLSPQEFSIITKERDSLFKFSLKKPESVHYKNLGVMLLHNFVFGDIMNEEEAQILYTKSVEEVLRLVRAGDYKLGFILPPLRAKDVYEVALSGEKMPHKTTYFYPKLLSGLVFHLLE
ncbi:MAG: DUF1015 domain-containing protein [Candidatus Dadabacteria bacterium]|nr:DUF1015 domain-containing protein [Candidatus Dadabacteria bacterium]